MSTERYQPYPDEDDERERSAGEHYSKKGGHGARHTLSHLIRKGDLLPLDIIPAVAKYRKNAAKAKK